MDNPDTPERPLTDEENRQLLELRNEIGEDKILEMLREEEIRDIFTNECGHCGGEASGHMAIETAEFKRGYKICETCARRILEWF